MVTRNLTDAFILMRNNSLQNRHIYNEQTSDDLEALVSRNHHDHAETTMANMPPLWVDSVDEVQYELTKIKQKMKDLSVLHDKHLHRPTLDDSTEEEYEIEITTQEITQMFQRCQRTIQQLNHLKHRGSSHNDEEKLSQNVVSSLARSVQDLSINFRRSQSKYLHQIKSREERSKQFFDIDLEDGYGLEEDVYDRGFSSEQVQLVEHNSVFTQEREKAVTQIVRSIHDLNDIFKDLASMIVDQGTILDRIDYNIEKTSTSVDKGLQQLQKAEKYQKKNRKMLVIMALVVIIIILIILLVAVKS